MPSIESGLASGTLTMDYGADVCGRTVELDFKLLDETTNQWKFTFSLAFGTLSGTATGDCAGTCSDNEDTTDEEDDGDGGIVVALNASLRDHSS